MKITKVECIPMLYKMKNPLYSGVGKFDERPLLLIKVHTNEGIIGIGEAATYGGPMISVATVIEHEIAPMVIGEDPLNVERIWHKCYYAAFQHARSGIYIAALSGVDMAIWDAAGKYLGQPLYKLLGGFRDSIPTYASCGFYEAGKTIDILINEVKTILTQGFHGVKIKVGRTDTPFSLGILKPVYRECMVSMEEDIERVRAVKKAIGPDKKLMVDANAAWSYNDALIAGKAYDEIGVYFFEEPVRTDDFEGSSRLASDLVTRIAGYETEYLTTNYSRLIAMHAVDIVQPDLSWTGGFTEVRKIAALADAQFIECATHMYSSAILLAASLHFTCAIPNGGILEYDTTDNVFRTELLTEPLLPDSSGIMHPDDKPGLGIELNESIVNKYRIR
jgi:L-alanine-DL-glutamate epimerase-like enolase superfamily enzyme